MDQRELELWRNKRANSPPPSQETTRPRRSRADPRPATPVHSTPRHSWLEDDPADFHTPAMAVDGQDQDSDPTTPQDPPQRKPILLETEVSTLRRSGRTAVVHPTSPIIAEYAWYLLEGVQGNEIQGLRNRYHSSQSEHFTQSPKSLNGLRPFTLDSAKLY